MKKDKNVKSILLIDECLFDLKGLEFVLNSNFENYFFFTSNNFNNAIDIIKTENLDLVILDFKVTGKTNLELVRSMKTNKPFLKILVFSEFKDKSIISRLKASGVNGFIVKSSNEQKITLAINQIFMKGTYFDNELSAFLLHPKNNDSTKINSLSDREIEIAILLSKGEKMVDISKKINIKTSTTSTYKKRIYNKLQIRDVVMLSNLLSDYNRFC